jgi:hypothetical protein
MEMEPAGRKVSMQAQAQGNTRTACEGVPALE